MIRDNVLKSVNRATFHRTSTNTSRRHIDYDQERVRKTGIEGGAVDGGEVGEWTVTQSTTLWLDCECSMYGKRGIDVIWDGHA